MDRKDKTFAIVGSGESLSNWRLRFDPHVTVIAVNGGLDLCEPHIWFTLDLSPINMTRLNRLPSHCRSIVAMDRGASGVAHMKMRIDTVLQRIKGRGHGRLRTLAGMSDDPYKIHTGNSMTGAIQVAAHMDADRIVIFGMDGSGGYADGPGQPYNLKPLMSLCDSLRNPLWVRGVEVINASPDSTVTTWERCSVERGIEIANG